MELITDPNLIFLDEPTTGLDSFTATSVMETLGDLARKENRTVISTIHQPNSEIFDFFDRLVLLARGKIIYFNEAKYSVDYFDSIGFKCPELSNPCDFFMTMMSKESIELDYEEEGQICSAGLDDAKIDAQYEKLIQHFDANYEKSELRMKPLEIHPEVQPLTAPTTKWSWSPAGATSGNCSPRATSSTWCACPRPPTSSSPPPSSRLLSWHSSSSVPARSCLQTSKLLKTTNASSRTCKAACSS